MVANTRCPIHLCVEQVYHICTAVLSLWQLLHLSGSLFFFLGYQEFERQSWEAIVIIFYLCVRLLDVLNNQWCSLDLLLMISKQFNVYQVHTEPPDVQTGLMCIRCTRNLQLFKPLSKNCTAALSKCNHYQVSSPHWGPDVTSLQHSVLHLKGDLIQDLSSPSTPEYCPLIC